MLYLLKQDISEPQFWLSSCTRPLVTSRLKSDIMSSTSDINDAERGVSEQGSSSLIPFTLTVQRSEPPSITNLSDPPTTSLSLDQTALERRTINDGKKELSKVPPIANIAGPENKKVPPKRRVSRWIQFKLWFNSYRLIFFNILSSPLADI